jgi:hypothetical protein
MLFAVRVEHARSHGTDARKHCRPIAFRDQDQSLRRGLPLWRLVLCFRKLCNVGAGVLQRGELSTARQRDRIVEAALPSLLGAQYFSLCNWGNVDQEAVGAA